MVDTTTATAILSETTVSLTQAAKILPATGRRQARPHISTLLRWVLQGARTPEGQVVRLEAVRFGAKWITSREAIARFAAALTPPLDGEVEQTPPRTPAQRQRAAERAGRYLEKLGI